MTNLVVVRGDSHTFTLTLTDTAGAPLDLTDADLTFTVEDMFAKTVGAGITVSSPLTGIAEVAVDPEDTENCPAYRTPYLYDVQVDLASGTRITPIRGRFIVLPDVTRP